MKDFVTLAFESWYINQNISGILKKCAENSGIPYRNIVGSGYSPDSSVSPITPSQYIYEKEDTIANWNKMRGGENRTAGDPLKSHIKKLISGFQKESTSKDDYGFKGEDCCDDKNSFYAIFKHIDELISDISDLKYHINYIPKKD